MDREPQAGGESRAGSAEAECVAAQNNAAAAAEQLSPAAGAAAGRTRPGLAGLAPWIVQLLWLAAGAAAIVYCKRRDWGPFEAIPFIISALFGMAAWLEWTVAWTILARRHLAERLAYFAVGVLGILIVGEWILEWSRSGREFPWMLGIAALGDALPLSLVYWRGWRIDRQAASTQQSASTTGRRGQFSIGEILWLTASVSIWLGLMTAQQSLMGSWGESASLHVVIACGTLLIVVGLAARRFVRATLCALLACVSLVVLTIAWAQGGADPNPTTWLLFGLICSPGFIGLLASIALARRCGYRLRRERARVVSRPARFSGRGVAGSCTFVLYERKW